MLNICVISDTHFKNTSNVRTGSLLEDQAAKLKFVVDYCKKHNAYLVHTGDVFDKPSVPDIVKNVLAPILQELPHKMLTIPGNHSILYNSTESKLMVKTSYQLWCSHGIIEDITDRELDLGECYLSSKKPVQSKDKPQVVIYHGFLNQDDGNNSFYFQDIEPGIKNKTYIILGHDHTVYDPLEVSDNVKIFRIGSFTRLSRDEESYRTPQFLHILVKDGTLKFKNVPITVARPADEIFKAKLTNVTKAQQRETYESIISQIREASTTKLTFEQAITQVASEEVSAYIVKRFHETKSNSQFDKQNL